MRAVTNEFTSVHFEDNELKAALAVSAYTYAYLQNKIADYAKAVVEFSYDSAAGNLQAAVLEHEVLKGKVAVLQELMMEFSAPVEAQEGDGESSHSQASHQ